MAFLNNGAVGKLIIRLALGLLILPHGLAKIARGVDGITANLANSGLPGFIAYGVYVGEVIAPLMLIAGFYGRVGALLIVINMLFAIALSHAGDIFSVGRTGGLALELQYLFLFASLAAAFLGPGRYSLNDR